MGNVRLTEELKQEVKEYYMKHCRECSIREIADKFNLTEVQVVRILNIKY